MRFMNFVQRPETEPVRRIGNVLAKGPPYTFRAGDAALARTTRPFCINVDRVHACPLLVGSDIRYRPRVLVRSRGLELGL